VLTATIEGALRRHATETYPREACGLVVRDRRGAVHALPCVNQAAARDQFEIAAADLLSLRRLGRELLAFYHSHPDGPPVMSQRDQRAAMALGRPAWPGVEHLVVSVPGGIAQSIGRFAWDADARRYLPNTEDP
jgi:[CysO sulfur-carrier protein]-S-L-cysteine hydrolase